MDKGYFDFAEYYELLKVELLDCNKPLGDDFSLQATQRYAVSVYTGIEKNELVAVSVSAQDIISRVYEEWGVNKLEDLSYDIPVLLMNNKFMDAEEQDFFVKLPLELYAEDSIDLKKDDVYISLLNMWVDKGFVVSRANISSADNIYELERIDREFDELLERMFSIL